LWISHIWSQTKTGQARACGVEYAENSHRMTAQLFADANANATSEKEDFMQTSFEPGSFDVAAFLVRRHFQTDPRRWSRKIRDAQAGRTAIINGPSFRRGSTVGCTTQGPENYSRNGVGHEERALLNLSHRKPVQARSYAYGRLSPGKFAMGQIPRPYPMLAC